MNKLSAILFLFLITNSSIAQSEIEMADQFRGEGKIYIVVAVILIILFGIFFSLIRLDKKLNKIEKGDKKEKI